MRGAGGAAHRAAWGGRRDGDGGRGNEEVGRRKEAGGRGQEEGGRRREEGGRMNDGGGNDRLKRKRLNHEPQGVSGLNILVLCIKEKDWRSRF